MRTARPGTPTRASRTGRPIMVLLDLLGRRWTLRVLWELRDAPLSFRDLRARCDEMSPSVLNTRLRELRDGGIVSGRRGQGYELTRHGRDLLDALAPIQTWANAWARRQRG